MADLNQKPTRASRDALAAIIVNLVNQHNALLAKLDADVGVTDTDYASTLTVTVPTLNP